MSMVEINKNPSPRDLRIFSAILPLFFGLMGALRWHAESFASAEVLWAVGVCLSFVSLVIPSARRWIYMGWLYLTFPIAWTVSHLILAFTYFLVATPIAFLLRLIGRDPMQRKFDKIAPSYWLQRQPSRDSSRYFRQF
jgi:endonuclease/exonuclease/phosphatase (EEP) superfamily protein YafD